MKKKIFVLLFLLIAVLSFTGCKSKKDKEAALDFKKEYESINEKEISEGKVHRTLSIPEDNPFEKVNPKEVLDMIDKKETFYLYVGDSFCPWCRSVLEKAIEVAKDNKIKKIYYIEIWDDEWNEIFRDKYELKDGKVSKVSDGTKEYKEFLNTFDSVLSDYTLTDDSGKKVEVGEKRIYAPNYFYIKDGKVVKMIEGISDKQKGSFDELTKEILKDEEKQFNKLFSN